MDSALTADNDAAAYLLLERLRWGDGPGMCPHCRSRAGCYFLRPADGVARPTRTGNRSPRRVWKCSSCRRQFSVLTGTVLEGTRIPLAMWVAAVQHLQVGDVPTAGQLRERHGLTSGAATRIAAVLDAVANSAPKSGAAPDAVLPALLALDRAAAAGVRAAGRRRRPRRQTGPTAEYGTDSRPIVS